MPGSHVSMSPHSMRMAAVTLHSMCREAEATRSAISDDKDRERSLRKLGNMRQVATRQQGEAVHHRSDETWGRLTHRERERELMDMEARKNFTSRVRADSRERYEAELQAQTRAKEQEQRLRDARDASIRCREALSNSIHEASMRTLAKQEEQQRAAMSRVEAMRKERQAKYGQTAKTQADREAKAEELRIARAEELKQKQKDIENVMRRKSTLAAQYEDKKHAEERRVAAAHEANRHLHGKRHAMLVWTESSSSLNRWNSSQSLAADRIDEEHRQQQRSIAEKAARKRDLIEQNLRSATEQEAARLARFMEKVSEEEAHCAAVAEQKRRQEAIGRQRVCEEFRVRSAMNAVNYETLESKASPERVTDRLRSMNALPSAA